MVSNVRIYGLEESIIASGYPMSVKAIEDMDNYILDYKDLKRAKKLASTKSGSGHDCFLKGIVVQFDWEITQLIYMQVERYHFIDIVSSMSKMHRITKLDLDKSMHEKVDKRVINILKEKIENFNNDEIEFEELAVNIPMGLKLTARFTTNYLQLKTIYHQRKNHKLKEWREFCDWVESLPNFKEWILDY